MEKRDISVCSKMAAERYSNELLRMFYGPIAEQHAPSGSFGYDFIKWEDDAAEDTRAENLQLSVADCIFHSDAAPRASGIDGDEEAKAPPIVENGRPVQSA